MRTALIDVPTTIACALCIANSGRALICGAKSSVRPLILASQIAAGELQIRCGAVAAGAGLRDSVSDDFRVESTNPFVGSIQLNWMCIVQCDNYRKCEATRHDQASVNFSGTSCGAL
jgi:hypothetical protein